MISIIIPVYNVEPYLTYCLDSVMNQTYSNIEIILVNDGSTDGSPIICDTYAKKDNRMKVIHKANGGLSDARNAGLEVATGDYIGFIDSDDIIATTMFETMYEILVNNSADIVECEFAKFQHIDELEKNHLNNSTRKIDEYNTEEALSKLMTGSLKQVVWNKIYKKDLIQNIYFKKGRINEDEFWTYKIFSNAKKIIRISDKLYFYRQQPDSIMGEGYNVKRLDGLDALEERVNFIREKYPNLLNLAIKTFCFATIYHAQKIFVSKTIKEPRAHISDIHNKAKKYINRKFLLSCKLKGQFWLIFFKYLPFCVVRLRNLFRIGI